MFADFQASRIRAFYSVKENLTSDQDKKSGKSPSKASRDAHSGMNVIVNEGFDNLSIKRSDDLGTIPDKFLNKRGTCQSNSFTSLNK